MFLAPLPADIAAERLTEFKTSYPKAAQASNGRAERAARLAEIAHLVETTETPGVYKVLSESNHLGSYLVDANAKTCTCPDHGKFGPAGAICKHRLVLAYLTQFGKSQAAPAVVVPTLEQLQESYRVLVVQWCILCEQIVTMPWLYRTEISREKILSMMDQADQLRAQIDALQPIPATISL